MVILPLVPLSTCIRPGFNILQPRQWLHQPRVRQRQCRLSHAFTDCFYWLPSGHVCGRWSLHGLKIFNLEFCGWIGWLLKDDPIWHGLDFPFLDCGRWDALGAWVRLCFALESLRQVCWPIIELNELPSFFVVFVTIQVPSGCHVLPTIPTAGVEFALQTSVLQVINEAV